MGDESPARRAPLHRASVVGPTDLYAAAIPEIPHRAGVHVNYQETKLRIKDGLPKMKVLPKEMGGSGPVVTD